MIDVDDFPTPWALVPRNNPIDPFSVDQHRMVFQYTVSVEQLRTGQRKPEKWSGSRHRLDSTISSEA